MAAWNPTLADRVLSRLRSDVMSERPTNVSAYIRSWGRTAAAAPAAAADPHTLQVCLQDGGDGSSAGKAGASQTRLGVPGTPTACPAVQATSDLSRVEGLLVGRCDRHVDEVADLLRDAASLHGEAPPLEARDALRASLAELRAGPVSDAAAGLASGRWVPESGGGASAARGLECWLGGACKPNSAAAMAASLTQLALSAAALARLASEQQQHMDYLTRMACASPEGAPSHRVTVQASLPRPVGLRPVVASSIVGMCNPLLDMSLRVDAEFLEAWGLEADSAILASEQHLRLFDEMAQNPGISYIPGGSGLNTMRVVQWILGTPGSTQFVGATGDDEFGRQLHMTTSQEDVGFVNLTVPDEQTGTCAVLTTPDSKRSLVANLGASSTFEESWLTSNRELVRVINGARYLYVTGFFLRTAPDTVLRVMRDAQRHATVALNLSAPFVVQALGTRFLEGVELCTTLFGNTSEYLALSDAVGWGLTDVEQIAKKAASLPCTGGKRMVIVTQGSDDLLVVRGTELLRFVTPAVMPGDIVDTSGAGDGFVGGFIAKQNTGADLADCVAMAQWAASIIIRRPGCSIPPLPPGCAISLSRRGSPAISCTAKVSKTRGALRKITTISKSLNALKRAAKLGKEVDNVDPAAATARAFRKPKSAGRHVDAAHWRTEGTCE